MKLWLDDIRDMPFGFDIMVRSARAAIAILKTGIVTEVSLDHDLGDDHVTGQVVADFIVWAARFNGIKRLKWTVHTSNGSARPRMVAALRNADRFWDKCEREVEDG